MPLLIICLIVSALYVGLNYRNSLLLDKDVREAKKRAVKPLFEPYKVPLSHELSYWLNWVIVITVLALLFSCVVPMKSGSYTIKAINGYNTVQLKEVKGDWHVPNADTLKVGQRIYLNRNKDLAKINVW